MYRSRDARTTACRQPAQPLNQGFTLIEVMLVVGIVGVLAAIAIPTYSNYVTRAKVSEGLTLAAPMKYAVSEYYAVNGGLPVVANNNWIPLLQELGLPASSTYGAARGAYVKRIWWNNNAKTPSIRIRYAGGSIEDKLLYLRAYIGPNSINWACDAPGSNGVPTRYLPAGCR